MSDKNMVGIWFEATKIIQEKIGPEAFKTWFSTVGVKEHYPNTLVIEAPDEFFKNWIVDHYLALIQGCLQLVSDTAVQLEFAVNPEVAKERAQKEAPGAKTSLSTHAKISEPLNPRFTFDSFVVGPSNRIAHAYCQAVAKSPAKTYNPLFIYGGVGLGKTHLMQAVAHAIKEANPGSKSCYTTSERFTNELIDAIQHRSTHRFREKYRTVDILLIDDIHFIAGKEATQEEFFHTFNKLYDDHKQIIISSDRSPREISHLEERLVSRFGWGLITDVQAPDLETRIAILRKKVEREPIKVPDDVIYFIAEQIKTNIRELEGALIRVVAYSLLEEKEISLSMAQEILKDMVKETKKNITIDIIQRKVADFFDLSLHDLKTKRRNKNIVLPRQIAMYLSRELTNQSLPEIGELFGGKDHTTVLHAWNKIKNGIDKDSNLKNTVNSVITEIQYR
ncbi:MAG: chromosomal replication initiator protein DnaA [Candidatus Omnitrophica bacterium]|nr:chromosomal replication initiator protein DnaA [Candidatus Omnitrophota bacterium]